MQVSMTGILMSLMRTRSICKGVYGFMGLEIRKSQIAIRKSFRLSQDPWIISHTDFRLAGRLLMPTVRFDCIIIYIY